MALDKASGHKTYAQNILSKKGKSHIHSSQIVCICDAFSSAIGNIASDRKDPNIDLVEFEQKPVQTQTLLELFR